MMNFVKKEHLYEVGGLNINGKKGFKYADIIISVDNNYYHAVFIKYQNYFTIKMADYQTNPTMEIALKALDLLCLTDMSGPSSEKPDKDKLQKIRDSLNPSQRDYRVGNYIIRLNENSISAKKTEFLLDATIPIKNLIACITNLNTILQITINNENKVNIDKYDKLYYVSADGDPTFRDLLCVKARPKADNITLDFISEHEYFMKHSQMNGVHITGNTFWAMQIMDYTLNNGRDNPIEMRYEGHPLNVGKKRFFFLFSIRGLKIENDVRFGLITLSTESGIDIEREKEYNSILSVKGDCYAQIAVVNDSLRSAIEDAITMVDKATTLLQILLLDDSPRTFFNTKDTYKSWDYKMISTALLVDEHFYVEDVLNNQQYAIINRNNTLTPQSFEIDANFSTLLNNNNILEDFFYLSQTKSTDDLLQAIIWLNASRRAADIKEKVISLYNCVEFLVTGEQGVLLGQELHSDYGDEYDVSITEIKKIVSNIENKKLQERMAGVITSSFEGNSSLQSKLESLIERLPITFGPEEWDLFKKLKQNRHRLIHNKKITTPITKHELNSLFHLFSKLIIYRIIDLNNGGNND